MHPLPHWLRSIWYSCCRFSYSSGKARRLESGRGRRKITRTFERYAHTRYHFVQQLSLILNSDARSCNFAVVPTIPRCRIFVPAGYICLSLNIFDGGWRIQALADVYKTFDTPRIPSLTLHCCIMATSMSSDDPQLRQTYRDFISGCHILHYQRYEI